MTTSTPLVLRRMAASHAALANALGSGLRAAIEVEDTDVEIELGGIDGLQVPSTGAELVLDTDFGTMALRPASELLRLLCGIDVPPQGDDETQWILAQAALANAPADWCRLFRLRSLQVGAGIAGGASVAMRLRPRGEGWSLAGELLAPAATLQGLIESPQWTACEPQGRLELDALLVRRRVQLGRSRISLQQLRELSTGDVVLVERALFDSTGAGSVGIGGVRIDGVLDEGRFLFERWSMDIDDEGSARDADDMEFDDDDDEFFDEESDLDSSERETPPRVERPRPDPPRAERVSEAPDGELPAGELPLEDLRLSLVFDVGTIELSLSDLKRLVPGSVIELKRPLPPGVTVRCHGRIVASGELVEVDGRLGVQIMHVERTP
ncbi:MAG TPA: type III secretion system cytoplasmic ring protein SctQ [Albitalea sp.]|uniref:type III secretion system cytoplasmic ring protein SctQ n=1 Tax=Piscinibacter sp. TaxID=1903157 RepID=UPI002ED51343